MYDGDWLDPMFSDHEDFGCCFPDECCMPGEHYRSECFTAEMAEQIHEEEEKSLKKPNAAKLQAECDYFNEKYPVGTPVRLKKDFVDEPIITKVKHPAYVMSGHSAVAFFEGISGCYHIRCATGTDTGEEWDKLACCWRKSKKGKGPAIAPVAARA